MDNTNTIRERFRAQQNAISSDAHLSAQGKKDKLDKARDDANAEISRLEETAKAASVAERTALERRLLTAPSASQAEAYSGAVGRAAMTDEEGELLALLHLAVLTGDQLLSRAALAVAMQRNAVDVINAFEEANPKFEADVERLWELTWNAAPTLDVATLFQFMRVY